MHTVYHTPDGRIFAVLANEDPDYEFAQRLAGVELRKLATDQITDTAQAKACCESGRVHRGQIVFGAEDVGDATRAIALDEVRAAVRNAIRDEVGPAIAAAVASAVKAAQPAAPAGGPI